MLEPIAGLPIVYEDESVVVVDKPSGMLSQPGRVEHDSVVSRVLNARPEAHGPLLVHRLDMDTSGLLLLAKTRSAHRSLQQQFEHRRISKRYLARLLRRPDAIGGRIHLPLRLDIEDRPRQVVCHEHGKLSTTVWHRTAEGDACCIWLYPLTGRTHQLRVHLAHPAGLGIGIQGDRLYPSRRDGDDTGSRLMLHAQYLAFDHPLSGVRQCLQSTAPLVEFGYKAS
jgi:tRNA pseudouridine32 synthase/23S rRNA pseudouridine746 synthase